MKSTIKGDLGKSIVIADLISKGFAVSVPFHEDSRYDLIIDNGNRLLRVQVKTVHSDGKIVKFSVRTVRKWRRVDGSRAGNEHRYTSKDIDLIAVCDINGRNVYYVGACELGNGMTDLTLRISNPENFQRKGVRLASDYVDVNAAIALK